MAQLFEDLSVGGYVRVVAPPGGGGYGFVFLAGSITDAHIGPGGPGLGIESSKLRHTERLGLNAAQVTGTAVVTTTTRIYNVRGSTGNVVEVSAQLTVACIGAATVTVDCKVNGTSILAAAISFGSGDAANAVKVATINTPAVVKGNYVDLVITATAGGGTVGQGITPVVSVDEDYN
jgi:hypothetical protein